MPAQSRSRFSLWPARRRLLPVGLEKMVMDRRIAVAGHKLEQWGLHDIRRSMRTRQTQMGVAPHVAELVLGHAAHKSGVAAAYDQFDYAPQIKDALARWARTLREILEGGEKVVPFQRTA